MEAGIIDLIFQTICNTPEGCEMIDLCHIVMKARNPDYIQGNAVSHDAYRKIEMVLNYLLKRDFIYLSSGKYYPTIEGVIFYNSPLCMFKNVPFRYERFVQRGQVWWRSLKIVAVIINAVLILWLGYLQVTKKEPTRKHIIIVKQPITPILK